MNIRCGHDVGKGKCRFNATGIFRILNVNGLLAYPKRPLCDRHQKIDQRYYQFQLELLEKLEPDALMFRPSPMPFSMPYKDCPHPSEQLEEKTGLIPYPEERWLWCRQCQTLISKVVDDAHL
jgi:hypothetical protein